MVIETTLYIPSVRLIVDEHLARTMNVQCWENDNTLFEINVNEVITDFEIHKDDAIKLANMILSSYR